MYQRFLSIIACLLICTATALAQSNNNSQQPDDNEGESIKIDAELVSVPVIVSDRTGRYIPGLSAEDFTIYEDGVKQDIEFFSVEATPFHVMLLIDASSSVSGSLPNIKNAALEFLSNLRDEDQVAAMAFSRTIYPLSNRFTIDKNEVINNLTFLRAGSTTSLYDAVYIAAHDVLKKITGRKAVILLTDGFDNSSRFSARQAIKEMVESGALVYVVRYPSGNPESQKLDFINELVTATAGVRFEAIKMNLTQPLQKIAAELRHIYNVGYYPSNSLQTGGPRKIQLTVKDNQDYILRYKKGYDASTFAAIKSEAVYLADRDAKTQHEGKPSFFLESKKDLAIGLGLLAKTIDAKPYQGKRIRLSGYLKLKSVVSWGGMWMRVDDQRGKPMTSDTMDERILRGSKDWHKYEIVLDVPEQSKTINYGILLDGKGKVWINKLKIEVVDKSVAVTATDNWQKYKFGETLTRAGFGVEE